MGRRILLLGLLCALVVAGLYGVARGGHAYRAGIVERAAEIARDDRTCFFDGLYSASGVPVARLVPESAPWFQPWPDISARFLAAEPAKPFHFGLVILRPAAGGMQAEIWGWSYRNTAFWRDETDVFRGAYRGDPVADCQGGP